MFNRLGAGLLATAVSVAGMWSGVAMAEQLALPGLSQKATIVRDAEGIAHIKARNRDDLYYLQGWVHAEDRLFQMEFGRRLGAAKGDYNTPMHECQRFFP